MPDDFGVLVGRDSQVQELVSDVNVLVHLAYSVPACVLLVRSDFRLHDWVDGQISDKVSGEPE
jgi:hypothetical protein